MKILGLGDHVVDVYRNLQKVYPGGNALNVAVNAMLLQYDSAYLGIFGDDVYGDFLSRFLREKYIDLSMCEYKKHASTKKCIEDVYEGERRFSHVEIRDNWSGILSLQGKHIQYINSFDGVFTSCNAKMEDQISLLKSYNGILVYDFGEKEKYRDSSYLDRILPYIDVAQFSMSDTSQSDIDAFVKTLPKDIVVLVTRGGKPTLCYQDSTCVMHAQTVVKAVDTMGAGDAYICAFVTSLMEQGWKKRGRISQTIALTAMKLASAHAIKICGMNGGFAYPYEGLRAVIFDMDGVLVDSEMKWLQLFRLFLKQHGHTLSKADENRLYGCSKNDEDRILGTYFHQDSMYVHDKKTAFLKEHEIHYRDIQIPYSAMLLEQLYAKGLQLVIASSSLKADIERMLEECELQKYFDFIVSGELFEESKPHPQIYTYCIDKLSMNKEQIVVIEDSTYGIEAASRAHLPIIHYRANTPAISSPYIVFESFSHEESWKFIEQNYMKKGERV